MTDMSSKPQTTDILSALQKALTDACAEDDKVVALGEDLADAEGGGILKVTKGLSTSHGTLRIKSTPISEQAIMGAAIGAAIGGYKPIAEIMLMNFTTVAMDMIVNHAAKLRYMSGGQTGVPLVIRTMTGLGFGNGGQHCDYLEAWFAHTAGLKVVAASTPEDSYGLLRSAVDDPDPVIFIENLPLYRVKMPGALPDSSYRVPLGKAAIQREGSDITIVSYARMARRGARSGSDTGRRRNFRRGDRPPHDQPLGPGNRHLFGPQDWAGAGRARGGAAVRCRRRNQFRVARNALVRVEDAGPASWCRLWGRSFRQAA